MTGRPAGSRPTTRPPRRVAERARPCGVSDGDNRAVRRRWATRRGSAQVGSPSLFAPVRVLSGGRPRRPGDESDAGDDAGDLAEDAARRAAGHPVRRRRGGGRNAIVTGAHRRRRAGLALRGGAGPVARRSRPRSGVPCSSPNGTGGTATGEVATLGVAAAGTLPYTGFGLVAVALLGLWLCSSGLALRLVPGGKRR